MLEPLLLMNGDDLLFAIGFYNLTPNLQMVLEHANKVNAPVILITDTLEPLSEKSGRCHADGPPRTRIRVSLLDGSHDDHQHAAAHAQPDG